MEKIKLSAEVTDEVLQLIGDKRTLPNKILCRKVSRVGHILEWNCFLHDAVGQIAEIKGVGRREQPLNDLRNRRIYCELKEEAED